MTEQLYKIERGRVDCLNCNVVAPATHIGVGRVADILVPVPAPHTLAWAMGEMYANDSMRAYSRPGGTEIRWNSTKGRFDSYVLGRWTPGILVDEGDMTSTSWAPCEAEPKPAIVPGSREWLLSLPDGTEVEHEKYDTGMSATKRRERLFANGWGDPDGVPISECADSGWGLRTQPQAAPYPTEAESRLDLIEDRITALELDTLEQ